MMFEDFEVVYSYTIKQALADGVLINVTEQAKENNGLRHPLPSQTTYIIGTLYRQRSLRVRDNP